MEAADGSHNSKVIVQLTDPSDLFDDVAVILQNRLPLGNLHWKSPTRPLRSIEELDVSLEREQTSTDGNANGARRHQIPGLRQTPFVKILLVRCDDKDKYKESVRKEVKDWVKAQGISASGKTTVKGQERHDAFEYIVLHVVLPGTNAATQPKSSKHISLEATESTDSVNSKSKWTGKSTSTIYDKLRADFHSSSKAPFERVAQVRLTDSSKPSPALSPLELEEQWQDLVEKLKVAILQSFDMRVAQYEEDIRERESQRSLPGWNFCTFFILKEGLARGFENVGLLEDALQIYEELDAGLDLVIQDQSRPDYADAANALLLYASDLKDTIRAVLGEQTSNSEAKTPGVSASSIQAWVNAETKRFPWRLERRDYQYMILTNQVSALDFRIYIFIRQMQNMLRRASMSIPSLRSKKSNRQSGPRWDADILAEICDRSVKFTNLAARNLRQDLFAAWGGQQGLPEEELRTQSIAIDNIVASWKWASLLQTLTECQIIYSLSSIAAQSNGDAEKGEMFGQSDITSSLNHQGRQSASTISSHDSNAPVSGTATPTDIFSSLRIVRGSKTNLAFRAAELFTMLRTILIQLCSPTNQLPFLHNAAQNGTESSGASRDDWIGILAPSLRSILRKEESCAIAYRLLTVCACQCYTTAGKNRATRQLLFDLAKLEAYNDKHKAATVWLDAVPGLLDTPPSTAWELSMLELYVDCLRKSNRDQDLAQSLFTCIQSSLAISRKGPSISNLWSELQSVAARIGSLAFPFKALFSVHKIGSHISHSRDNHLSSLPVSIRSSIPVEALGDGKVVLECRTKDQTAPNTILFDFQGELVPHKSCIEVILTSSVISKGWYESTSLQIIIGNITFERDLKEALASEEDRSSGHTSARLTLLYLYPPSGAPCLQASHTHLVDLSAKRGVSISINWGSADITSAQIRLKSATAGLRLDLQSAKSPTGQEFETLHNDEGYVLGLGAIRSDTETMLDIPYQLEDGGFISASIRAEVRFRIGTQEYTLFDDLSFMTLLPIDISVQDIFQKAARFSRFTFSPSRFVPISITGCELQENQRWKTISHPWRDAADAFPKQPVKWLVQTVSKDFSEQKSSLQLSVEYRCMDEVILQTLVRAFSTSVDASLYAFAARPLGAHFKNRVQSSWTEQDIELATLLCEVDMWSYEELDWTSLLYAFDKKIRPELQSWLQEWHRSHEVIPLQHDLAPIRKLQLWVDTPQTQIIVTTQLELTESRASVVGQPVLAQLLVSAHANAGIDAEVSVVVNDQPESWLVGGQRKITFGAAEESARSNVILVAQKTGLLALPVIEVTCRSVTKAAAAKPIAFEVDNLSCAKTVQVKSSVKSTTLGIGDGETAEGHWRMVGGGRRSGSAEPPQPPKHERSEHRVAGNT